MTRDHMGVSSDPLCRYIKNLPLGKRSIHDIHLRFKVNGIWKILSTGSFPIIANSKDIRLRNCSFGKIVIKTTVHRTDTVTIVIGCSYAPIPLHLTGLVHLSNSLAVIRDRILVSINDCLEPLNREFNFNSIPEHGMWIVTMWHLGADGIVEYTGEKFSISWDKIEQYLIRIYSKEMCNGKTIVRIESQEYPNKVSVGSCPRKT